MAGNCNFHYGLGMSGGGETRPLITPEVEEQVLDILDRTEAGAERDAALQELGLTQSILDAVLTWLDDESEEDSFLATPVSGPAISIDAQSLPRTHGNYELFRVLGKGGMGIVYGARDTRLGRTVALKVLPEHFADNPKRLQRFEREVRAIAALQHNSIVQVFEAGTLGRTPYFTMELVDGLSLEKVVERLRDCGTPTGELRRRHWSEAVTTAGTDSSAEGRDRPYVEAVCRLVIAVADALQHAHDHKIIHRDVKPSNIMVPCSGEAKLFDFGLARLEDDAAVTKTSEVIGSPHYMSPEQLGGRHLDHRTDVYSLGITLYELLTLQVPFAGSAPQQIYQRILNEEPTRPSLLNPGLPKDLETICLTATEKRPERRYATASEFAEDLRRFLRFEPVQARPIGSLTRSVRWLRRNLATAAIVTLAITCLASVLTILIVNGRVATAEYELASAEQKKSEADALAKKARKDADAAKAELDAARKKTKEAEGLAAKTKRHLNELQADERKLQSELHRVSSNLTQRERELETRNQDLAQKNREVANKNRELATKEVELKSKDQQLHKKETDLRALEADREKAIRELGDLTESHNITTINRLLMEAAALRDQDPSLGLLLSYEAVRLAETVAPDHGDPSLQARVDANVLSLLQHTQEQLTFSKHQHQLTAVAFDPTGLRLVSAASDGTVHFWTRSDGSILDSWRHPTTSVVHVEFLDDRTALLADQVGKLLLWTPNSGRSPEEVEGLRHLSFVRRHVSPKQDFILGHGTSGGQLLAVRRDGRKPFRLGPAGTKARNFEFSSAGPYVGAVTSDNRVQVHSLKDGSTVLDIAESVDALAVTFDTTGRQVAWLLADASVHVADIETGNRLLDAQIDEQAIIGAGRIEFCNDDQHLLLTGIGAPAHYLLRAKDGQLIRRLPAGRDVPEFTLGRPDKKLACFATQAGRFYLVDTTDGAPITELRGHTRSSSRYPAGVAFSPIGDTIATVHGDTTVRLWRTRPGGALTTLGLGRSHLDRPSRHPRDAFRWARFAKDGAHVLVVGARAVSRWHVHTGRRVDYVRQDPFVPTHLGLLAPDGGSVFAIAGNTVHRIGDRSSPFRAHPDGRRIEHLLWWPAVGPSLTLAATKTRRSRELRMLAAKGHVLTQQIPLPQGVVGAGRPLPSPRGDAFLVGYDNLYLIHRSAPTKPKLLKTSARPATFTPDGAAVAASTGFGVQIFRTDSGEPWFTLRGLPRDFSQLSDLAFAPDGLRIATAWSDGIVRIHDTGANPGQILHEAKVHTKTIRSVVWSRDGRLLVTASEDGASVVLDAATTRPRLRFEADVPCRFADFDSAARRVLVVCDEAVHTFPLAVRTLARNVRPRLLRPEERTRFNLRTPSPNRVAPGR